MFIYSKNIVKFIQEIQSSAREILAKEIKLRVLNDRFYNRAQTASYPIRIVIYNNKKMLGYFDSHFCEMGFHECLMHVNRETLQNVIRHELAHYVTFINSGADVQPHGAEFKAFCEKMGWGERVSRAQVRLEEETGVPMEGSGVLRKVQKLMALASSSSPNEAEQAMIKSQQLLLKHNIESKYIGEEDDEQMVLKRVLKQKRDNAKMRAIAKILATFFVSVVFRKTEGYIHLEILGSPVNAEIAEYVAGVLQGELDLLWEKARKNLSAQGTIAKNSFFLGLAKGYCDRLKTLNSTHATSSLMIIEKKLIEAQKSAYGRLSSRSSRSHHCPVSSSLGEKMGRDLNINRAIGKASPSGMYIEKK